jgi:glycosyltransferase involved in cell wall biosynthesis
MRTAILHYSVPPVVGGVEAVIQAHTGLLLGAGYPVTLIAGAGNKAALPTGAEFIRIPEMDSRHPQIAQVSQELEAGKLPDNFETITADLERSLVPALEGVNDVIIHNVFTKHFNLPLTAALTRLLDQKKIKHCIAWCHDFTWTSAHSQSSVHPGFPWDLLRTYREDVTYVTVSQHRQAELAGLFNCAPERIHVVYNGVDPEDLYSLSAEGRTLVKRLNVNEADLVLLMPVRITQAKNIELALQVTARLKSKGISPKLVVTGPPDPHDPENMEYYESLLELRRKLGVEREAGFVYSLGPHTESGYTIDLALVRVLYRASDVLFMPSHREGFGMPILEAGLIGMPIFSADIPATDEIGGQEVFRFSADAPADQVAEQIVEWARNSPLLRLRQRIRKNFTWQAIFNHDILPLLTGGGKV